MSQEEALAAVEQLRGLDTSDASLEVALEAYLVFFQEEKALAVIEMTVADASDIRLGDAQGPSVDVLDLPYAFDDSGTASGG